MRTPSAWHRPATSTPLVEARAAVRRAVDALAAGAPIVVLDDADREGEGDLVLAARHATPESMAFLLRHTCGIVCCALSEERADALDLPLMVDQGEDRHGTAFTVTVDLAEGTHTGISAADRAATLRALADGATRPDDLNRPGHIFPLRARPGGVLERRGHTEASVDLVTMAGLESAAVICELVNDDGSVSTLAQARAFAEAHGLAAVTVDELVDVRHLAAVGEVAPVAALPTRHGTFDLRVVPVDGVDQVVATLGEVRGAEDLLTRVHSECFTGDVLGSHRCDCGDQLDASMRMVADVGRGAIVYVRGHEGRGIGLAEKLRAYALQDRGLDTIDANLALGQPIDGRDYAAPAAVLAALGVRSVELLTNNPHKVEGLRRHGVEVVGRRPVVAVPRVENLTYLETKRRVMGHLLPTPLDESDAQSSGIDEALVVAVDHG